MHSQAIRSCTWSSYQNRLCRAGAVFLLFHPYLPWGLLLLCFLHFIGFSLGLRRQGWQPELLRYMVALIHTVAVDCEDAGTALGGTVAQKGVAPEQRRVTCINEDAAAIVGLVGSEDATGHIHDVRAIGVDCPSCDVKTPVRGGVPCHTVNTWSKHDCVSCMFLSSAVCRKQYRKFAPAVLSCHATSAATDCLKPWTQAPLLTASRY